MTFMALTSVISATGSYVPEKILTNDAISRMVDTNDEWIRARTGIEQRHIAADNETTTDMAAIACQRAIQASGLSANDIDGIVVGTSTPAHTMPSVATEVQARLGLPDGPALDVAAACTGFVYALATAHGWIQAGLATHVLVVGAECMSRIVDWNDRGTCILFGDGAGAVILSASEDASRGMHAISLQAQGRYGPLLGTNGGVASTKTAGHLSMQGQEVFKHGVEKMSAITTKTLEKAGKSIDQLDWVIAHQANGRMISMIARTLGVASSKCVVTVNRHGNTSAASIPLALDYAVQQQMVTRGNLLALPALGAGLSWGCCVITY
jgi:3-oxoacyl-[acyl-carrier-protein] synthase-3